jgi:hypothetical protein
LQPDSDLGARLVTRDVGQLSEYEIDAALEAGAALGRQFLSSGLIEGATLRLMGRTARVGARRNQMQAPQASHYPAPEMMHA